MCSTVLVLTLLRKRETSLRCEACLEQDRSSARSFRCVSGMSYMVELRLGRLVIRLIGRAEPENTSLFTICWQGACDSPAVQMHFVVKTRLVDWRSTSRGPFRCRKKSNGSDMMFYGVKCCPVSSAPTRLDKMCRAPRARVCGVLPSAIFGVMYCWINIL
jgi:hypothetical protein